MARTPIGEMLKGAQLIDDMQLQSAVAYQQKWGGRIGQAMVRLGFLQEPALLSVIGQQLEVPFVEIGDRFVPPSVIKLVPEKLIRSRKVFPLTLLSEGRRGPLVVALAQPENLTLLDEIAFATGFSVKPMLASEPDIDRAIARHLDGKPGRADSIPAPAVSAAPAPVEEFQTESRRRRFH